MNNKEFNNKIKQEFEVIKRNHSFDNFESLVNCYGEQSREDFNNLLEFSSYDDYNCIEKFKNALTKVENGYYLRKENCYILDF